MKQRRFIPAIIIGAFFLLLVLYQLYKGSHFAASHRDDPAFNRGLTPLIYTKHARCRMDCRHIDESEIKDILLNGTINYQKSEPESTPDPKYALEGITHDNQHVRIIFAPSKRGMVVITCIDINQEWTCNCR